VIQEGPLDELASTFVVPSKSGVYLTKSEMIALARICEGSLRISDRKRMLADVLKSPDSPEALARLMGHLVDFCSAHVARYEELAADYPSLAPLVAGPAASARRTIERLEALRVELKLA
jgi:hypothetical protein